MSAVLDYMQLCRLCLVKDKVNVPIFGDTNDLRQIFLKITACLPIKVSEDDNLPKKICDACLYKVDLLYQFWNTTVNAEKQLIQWLGEIGIDVNLKSGDPTPIQIQSHAHPHSIHTEIMLKEEGHDSESKPAENYVPTQQIVYGSYSQQFPQPTDTVNAEIGNTVTPAATLDSTNNFSQAAPVVNEMKRARTRQATKKLQQTAPVSTSISTTVTSPAAESMDEDSNDRIGAPDDSDDSMVDTGDRIAKEEAESEEEYDENVESLEPTTFVGVPSTPALCDSEQPGPSGLSKQTAATTDRGIDIEERNSIEPPQWGQEKEVSLEERKCTICFKEFTDSTKFRKHKRNHAERIYPCEKCGKKFRFPYDVRKHDKTHSSVSLYKCENCNNYFKTKYSLMVHERRHKEDYKEKCKECGKGFYTSSDCLEHFQVHHEGFRYNCKHCNKIFMTVSYYGAHLKTHDPLYVKKGRTRNKKLHVCDICGKTLTEGFNLRSHMLIHTGERPFNCDICGKTFNKYAVLKVHERTHKNERPYSCTLCDKTFTQRGSLVIHMRYHTGQRPYKCNICQKDFVTKTLMKTHSNKIHGL